MQRIKVRKLVWDDWNTRRIKKHRVSVKEVEEVCKQIAKSYETYKRRLVVLGRTRKGRWLTIVMALQSKGKYYVVTARNMSRKERRLLEND